eukprot:TRINITY_DN95404_c0_g1_i1.p1 TRINITY_DN95404_c0_g1~~TRINITY_DN95404_c0_g1_i1.p1  ORF type:complete len:122 (+),score=15.84 TRINITY_DN95404_c0_g1_i1:217-582(+)
MTTEATATEAFEQPEMTLKGLSECYYTPQYPEVVFVQYNPTKVNITTLIDLWATSPSTVSADAYFTTKAQWAEAQKWLAAKKGSLSFQPHFNMYKGGFWLADPCNEYYDQKLGMRCGVNSY